MRPLAATAPLVLLCPAICAAATIHVPGDQPTIQAGVNAASDGDTVLLADGTYQGPGNRDVTVIGKRIVIRSASDDPDLCVIDPQGAPGDHHRAFLLQDLPGPDAGLRSLTIRGAYVGGPSDEARGGALLLTSSSEPLIENVRFVSNVACEGGAVYASLVTARFVDCEFVGNRAANTGATGGAVYLGTATASFVRCRFTDNYAREVGGAILAGSRPGGHEKPVSLLECELIGNKAERAGALWAGGRAFITDCRFVDNRADDSGGAVLAWEPISITDCWFVGNRADRHAALKTTEDLDLVGSTFSGNQALHRGCVHVAGSDPVTISDCDFVGNVSVLGTGGSLWINTTGPVAVDRCRFLSNRASLDGGAIHVDPYATGEIRESLFVDNVAGREAGALLVESASFLVERCTFARNSATQGGGIIVFRPLPNDPDRHLLVRHSVIAFNQAGGTILCSDPRVTTTCSNVFGNAGGDALCGTDGGGNFSADPLFCDPGNGDFTLSSPSPCLPGNHPDGADCGLIGALGLGCGPVSVEPETWAGIKARYRGRGSGEGP